jgi:hypothetical protein
VVLLLELWKNCQPNQEIKLQLLTKLQDISPRQAACFSSRFALEWFKDAESFHNIFFNCFGGKVGVQADFGVQHW